MSAARARRAKNCASEPQRSASFAPSRPWRSPKSAPTAALKTCKEIAARTSQGDKLGHAITEVGRKMRAEQKAAVAALGVRLEGLDSRIAVTVAAQRKLYARHATFECEVKRGGRGRRRHMGHGG